MRLKLTESNFILILLQLFIWCLVPEFHKTVYAHCSAVPFNAETFNKSGNNASKTWSERSSVVVLPKFSFQFRESKFKSKQEFTVYILILWINVFQHSVYCYYCINNSITYARSAQIHVICIMLLLLLLFCLEIIIQIFWSEH